MILILIIFAMISAYLFKDQGFYLLQKDGQLEGSIKSILSTYFTPSRFSLFCFCTAFAILTNYNSESKFCFKIFNVDEQYYNAANYHFMLLIVLALSRNKSIAFLFLKDLFVKHLWIINPLFFLRIINPPQIWG